MFGVGVESRLLTDVIKDALFEESVGVYPPIKLILVESWHRGVPRFDGLDGPQWRCE